MDARVLFALPSGFVDPIECFFLGARARARVSLNVTFKRRDKTKFFVPRQQAMLGAAMRGDLGPLAQAVAKYQMERRLQQEMERLKALEEKLKEMREKNKSEEQEVRA